MKDITKITAMNLLNENPTESWTGDIAVEKQ
jgi:hypothetical protein